MTNKNNKKKTNKDYEDFTETKNKKNKRKSERIKDKVYLKDVLDGNINEEDYYDYNNLK